MSSHIQDKAVFNLALPYLARINELLSDISRSFRNGDFSKMQWCLRSLYRELAPKLKVSQRESFEGEWEELLKFKTDYEKWRSITEKCKPKVKSQARKIKQNKFKVYIKKLEDIDITLRDCLEVRGMLVPSKRDARLLGVIMDKMEDEDE